MGSGLAGTPSLPFPCVSGQELSIAVISKVQVMRSHSVSAEGGTVQQCYLKKKGTIGNLIFTIQLEGAIFSLTKMLQNGLSQSVP